ncbi:MAG TPA: hypothetical protein VII57_03305, partial [Dehalococcoidia bacterium]
MILHAILGLVPDAPGSRLFVVRPRLPYWLESVRLKGLRVGRGHADLLFERRGMENRVHVLAAEGLRIRVVDHWPRQQRPRRAATRPRWLRASTAGR